MPPGAFDEAVQRHLRGRSIRTVERDAGLPSSSLKNMRKRPSMPPASQIETVAQALGASTVTLTWALLVDRGYNLGASELADAAELSAVARSITPRQRQMLLRLVELLNEWPEKP